MTTAIGGKITTADPSFSLCELSRVLRCLHKALLDAELDNFPMARSGFDRLKLVVDHPSFAWLHALSKLIVELAPEVALATGSVRQLLAGRRS